jgi:hypothetical protein
MSDDTGSPSISGPGTLTLPPLDPESIAQGTIYYTDSHGAKHAVARITADGVHLYRGASVTYSDERGVIAAREERPRWLFTENEAEPSRKRRKQEAYERSCHDTH